MTRPPRIKAVIFDIGGVVVRSPLLGVNKYEHATGLPHDYLNLAITARGPAGAFQRLETGRVQFPEFYAEFGKEMSDAEFNNAAYERFCVAAGRVCPALPTSLKVDGKELWKQMMTEASSYNLPIIAVIKRLRGSGRYRVAALTNNFQVPPGVKEGDEEALGSATTAVKSLFDDFIESSEVGLRKPDPNFFQYALDRLNVRAHEALFLDDIGLNLKAARKLGIHTIRVGIHDVRPALLKLQEYLPEIELGDRIVERSKL